MKTGNETARIRKVYESQTLMYTLLQVGGSSTTRYGEDSLCQLFGSFCSSLLLDLLLVFENDPAGCIQLSIYMYRITIYYILCVISIQLYKKI